MRLILMGTGPFAVPTFDALMRSDHDIVAVVTRPVPEARGRRHGPANPVRDFFAQHDARLLAPGNVNDALVVDELRALRPDLLVVCDFGQILSPQCLEVARCGGINLHGSLLPKYRGAAPINWAIWNGEAETGVTVIHMTPRLDAGPCLLQLRTAIESDEDAVQLEHRLALLGIESVEQSIAMLESWDGRSPLGEIQDQSAATKAPRLQKSDGRVDWACAAQRICNQVRALRPWPGTYTQWQRSKGPLRLILERVSIADDVVMPLGTEPGQIVECNGDHLVVATSAGCLAIHDVKPAGKRRLSAREFLRGYPVNAGEVLV